MIEVKKVNKSFTLFNQNNAKITVFKNLNFEVNPGEIVALKGPSGIGKSSILKMIYGSYIIDKIFRTKIDINCDISVISI